MQEFTINDITEYKDEHYNLMREFYFQILYESRYFTPYTPTLDKGHFNDPNMIKFNIINDSRIIAHLSIQKHNDSIFSLGVAVLKEFENKKIGSLLVDFALLKIKELGGNVVKASINKDNWKSILLFVKKGFIVTEEKNVLFLEKEI